MAKRLEDAPSEKAERSPRSVQPGDTPTTSADADRFVAGAGFEPSTSTKEGLGRFTPWYRRYSRQALS